MYHANVSEYSAHRFDNSELPRNLSNTHLDTIGYLQAVLGAIKLSAIKGCQHLVQVVKSRQVQKYSDNN